MTSPTPTRTHPAADAPAAERERRQTDTGAYADKVAAPDPAAAPLGTDAEAAGEGPADAAGDRPHEAAPVSGGIKAGPPPSGREWRIVLPVLAVILVLAVAWFIA